MDLIHRISDRLRYGRPEHRDPAAVLTAARWRHRVMVADVDRELGELADERSYAEAEIARSRATVMQLKSDVTAAETDGCADIAEELREERMQTEAFLGELTEVRQAIATEEARLLRLRKRLTGSLAEDPAAARPEVASAHGEGLEAEI